MLGEVQQVIYVKGIKWDKMTTDEVQKTVAVRV